MNSNASYEALLTGRWITDLANTSAYLFHTLPDLNWAGFYLIQNDVLYLGPFQGKVACTEIPLGKGVCGTAALKKEPIVVPDVHAFPGHIACDAASQSEIVIPLLNPQGQVIGVLDLDSPKKARFQKADQQFLQAMVQTLLAKNPSHA